MSVAQGLVASTSQMKTDIEIENPAEYDINLTEDKPSENNIEMELKIAYVDPTNAISGLAIYVEKLVNAGFFIKKS
ncbi:unnamed protein product [Pieris brassicae]|uniref:Uncharacterized protein n=1 Tax=Pieris brassicae TaxID=7116 RepID=A0A9P0U030_PIEBR|nr:unnamed protein product [Pieris brassicae]